MVTKKRKKKQAVSAYLLSRSRKNAYRILTALRGPDAVEDECDYDLTRLKAAVTGRLRTLVFGGERLRGAVVTPVKLTPTDVALVHGAIANVWKNPEMRRALFHYLIHLIEAVEATVNHPIWGGNGRALLDELLVWRKKGTEP